MRRIKIVLWIIAFAGLVVLFLLVGLPGLNKVIAYEKENRDYTLHTTPLKAEVIRDVCEKFEISDDDPRCKLGATVYAPEFFPDIKTYIRALPEEKANVEYIDNLLGKYELYRGPITRQKDGTEYFTITYDLRGNHVHRIIIWVNKDDKIINIMTTSGGS